MKNTINQEQTQSYKKFLVNKKNLYNNILNLLQQKPGDNVTNKIQNLESSLRHEGKQTDDKIVKILDDQSKLETLISNIKAETSQLQEARPHNYIELIENNNSLINNLNDILHLNNEVATMQIEKLYQIHIGKYSITGMDRATCIKEFVDMHHSLKKMEFSDEVKDMIHTLETNACYNITTDAHTNLAMIQNSIDDYIKIINNKYDNINSLQEEFTQSINHQSITDLASSASVIKQLKAYGDDLIFNDAYYVKGISYLNDASQSTISHVIKHLSNFVNKIRETDEFKHSSPNEKQAKFGTVFESAQSDFDTLKAEFLSSDLNIEDVKLIAELQDNLSLDH